MRKPCCWRVEAKGRDGKLQYVVNFNLRKPVTEELHVTVDFENPGDKESPLFAELELAPGTSTFEARSEFFSAIRNRYKTAGTHEQLVLFNMPAALLEQLGIQLL